MNLKEQMMAVEDVATHVETPIKRLKFIANILPACMKRDNGKLSMGGVLSLLICDFFLKVGTELEDISPVFEVWGQDLEMFAAALISTLDKYEVETQALPLPSAWIETLDARYVVFDRLSVYDMKEGVWLKRIPPPPVFSVSLALHALVLRTVAKPLGYTKAAERFMSGQLTTNQSSETEQKG